MFGNSIMNTLGIKRNVISKSLGNKVSAIGVALGNKIVVPSTKSTVSNISTDIYDNSANSSRTQNMPLGLGKSRDTKKKSHLEK